MIDLNLISRGAKFTDLKRTYIIFICLDDPFKNNLPIYTFENRCLEDNSISLKDDATKVIVNANGKRDNLSSEMIAFLDYLQNGRGSSEFTSKLETAVKKAKEHKEWEVEFMTMYMKIQEEREDAKIEQIIETSRLYNASDEQIVENLVITPFY